MNIYKITAYLILDGATPWEDMLLVEADSHQEASRDLRRKINEIMKPYRNGGYSVKCIGNSVVLID